MSKELESRLIDMEMKVTHQDLLLEQLNGIVYDQATQIDRLEKALTQLVKRFKTSGAEEPSIGPANEKPPHY